MTGPTAVALLLFACPAGITQEAYCGPATGLILIDGTMDDCQRQGQQWLADQERMATGLRHLVPMCKTVGIGIQGDKP